MEFEKSLRELEKKIEELRKIEREGKVDMGAEIAALVRKSEEMRKQTYAALNAWQVVQLMRHPDRPHALDYVESLFSDFYEVHGDRTLADDKAIVAGFGRLDGTPMGILGTQKGRDTKENLLRNFGMAQPDGYRKALRFMRLCEKFRLPLLTFIDTAGAYPGIEGEERSVAEAIARNLFEMSRLKVPIIVAVIGEGGSGGALGIGVGDRVLMLENAYYSVISPEGCAAILWRDRGKAEQAAAALKGTAKELLELKVIDEIVKEPLGGAHQDAAAAAAGLKESVKRNLKELQAMGLDALLEARYRKFRAMGVWEEVA
jgi:acetyl-CoA carboxylase carboxyl transferase subunit alpha